MTMRPPARTSASWPTRLVGACMSVTVSLLPPRSRSAWLRSSVDVDRSATPQRTVLLRLASGEKFEPVGAEFSGWGDVPVEGLAGDAEFGAEVADLGVGLAHGGSGQAELGRGHLEGPAASAAASTGGGQTADGAFGDEFAFDSASDPNTWNTNRPPGVVVSGGQAVQTSGTDLWDSDYCVEHPSHSIPASRLTAKEPGRRPAETTPRIGPVQVVRGVSRVEPTRRWAANAGAELGSVDGAQR